MLLRLTHASTDKGREGANGDDFGRLLDLVQRPARHEFLHRGPLAPTPETLHHQLAVLDGSTEIGNQIPLVELFRRVQPLRLPQAHLRLGHPRGLARGGELNALEKGVLRLLPVSVLDERQTHARDV